MILTDGLWARPGSIDTESVYAYHDDMNITLSIEEEVVKRAHELAKRRGKSLNDMIRDYLNRLTDPMTPEEAITRLHELWETSPGHPDPDATWTREELNVRPRFR